MIPRYKDSVANEEIDGIVYTSSKFTCTKALSLLGRTVKVVGDPGLRSFVAANAEAFNLVFPTLVEGAAYRVYPAMVQFAYGLEADPELPRDLCENLKASKLLPANDEGGPVFGAFETHFSGEYPHLISALSFVLTHNFAGFTLGSHLIRGSRTNARIETGESSDPETLASE